MSTDNQHHNSSSIHSATAGFAPARSGAMRPARPSQLSPGLVENLAGGVDPQAISEMSHASAAALLDRVHHTEDPQVVRRVLTLVDTEGVDIIAQLWSDADPDSLPGVLWRLYMLRTWCAKNKDSIAQLWRLGEPVVTSASAIAGVDLAPSEEDIARIADSILSGAFTGDFAVALERAGAFTTVVAHGLQIQAKRVAHGAGGSFRHNFLDSDSAPDPLSTELSTLPSDNGSDSNNPDSDSNSYRDGSRSEHSEHSEHSASHQSTDVHTAAARILHTAGNLQTTSHHFRHAAELWRVGKLD